MVGSGNFCIFLKNDKNSKNEQFLSPFQMSLATFIFLSFESIPAKVMAISALLHKKNGKIYEIAGVPYFEKNFNF